MKGHCGKPRRGELRHGRVYNSGHLTQPLVLSCVALAALIAALSWARMPDARVDHLLNRPAVPANHKEQTIRVAPANPGMESALVREAKRFALYLNPPIPHPQRAVSMPTSARVAKKRQTLGPPQVRPPQSKARFRVLAIGYTPQQPNLSLALIAEPGGGNRWVKAGDQVGHLLVERIERGTLVYRDGSRTGEVEVVREETPRSAQATLVASGKLEIGDRR